MDKLKNFLIEFIKNNPIKSFITTSMAFGGTAVYLHLKEIGYLSNLSPSQVYIPIFIYMFLFLTALCMLMVVIFCGAALLKDLYENMNLSKFTVSVQATSGKGKSSPNLFALFLTKILAPIWGISIALWATFLFIQYNYPKSASNIANIFFISIAITGLFYCVFQNKALKKISAYLLTILLACLIPEIIFFGALQNINSDISFLIMITPLTAIYLIICGILAVPLPGKVQPETSVILIMFAAFVLAFQYSHIFSRYAVNTLPNSNKKEYIVIAVKKEALSKVNLFTHRKIKSAGILTPITPYKIKSNLGNSIEIEMKVKRQKQRESNKYVSFNLKKVNASIVIYSEKP